MLYACHHPDRIAGLFLQSPASVEDETSENFTYDPYTIRKDDSVDQLPSRRKVDTMLAKYREKDHFMSEFNKIPNCVRKRMAGVMMKKMLSRDVFAQGFIDGSARYWSLMLERLGKQEIVILVWSYYLGHLHNSFFTKDRML